MGVISYQPLQKENDKRMGLVSRAVPRMVKITINTTLTGGFIAYLLLPISSYSPRFSDRDLLMRYHWGLGVGHFHAHQSALTSGCISDLTEDAEETQVPDPGLQETLGESHAQDNDRDSDSMGYESEKPELCLEDLDLEGWDDVEMDDGEDGDGDGDEDPEDFTGM